MTSFYTLYPAKVCFCLESEYISNTREHSAVFIDQIIGFIPAPSSFNEIEINDLKHCHRQQVWIYTQQVTSEFQVRPKTNLKLK